MKWIIICLLLYIKVNCEDYDNLEVIAKSRTTTLEKFEGYVNVIIIHLEIPDDTSFASFKFTADEIQISSIFGCTPRKVMVYMKYNSLPFINPDNSKIPPTFKNISRSEIYELELLSDNKSVKYFNVTNPQAGCYFFMTFLPYSDPQYDPIQPDGLGPNCHAFVDLTTYIKRASVAQQIMEDSLYQGVAIVNTELLYEFYAPKFVHRAVLKLSKIVFGSGAKKMIVRVHSNGIPSENQSLIEKIIESDSNQDFINLRFNTLSDSWHYITVKFQENKKSSGTGTNPSFQMYLKFFIADNELNDRINQTMYMNVYDSDLIQNVVAYKEYELVRESTTDTFSYSYELQKKSVIVSNLAINITSEELVLLKFTLHKHTDIGGVLNILLSFKPRINKAKRLIEPEPENHTIIACVRPESAELPSWPKYCAYKDNTTEAPLVLNKTTTNSTMMVPFPEGGLWFVSFKLYCGKCTPCDCPEACQKEFQLCVEDCEVNCIEPEICNKCSIDCKNETVSKGGCEKCDCEGPCLRNPTVCNSSVIFDVSSTACAKNCGRNGRCMFMVSDGIVFATCVCTNNYRGVDCSDNTHATPYYMVVLELLLLVLSNLMFLPSVYFAYRRKYYVEAITYFSICFFSSFYHACDAGEKIISFCIARLSALQFADFYCALLSIWVTLIAIADLPYFWPTLFQITGAIILAFTTTVNKTGLWGFVLPAVIGLVVIAVSWFMKYHKVKQMFLNRRYLMVYVPMGVVVVVVGIVIFTVLETPANYKYLHSMWHVMMAIAVIILLPRQNTFQPEVML